MVSSNLVDWRPVMAWTKGLHCEIFLEPPQSFLRLETYVPPIPPVHIPDNDPKDGP